MSRAYGDPSLDGEVLGVAVGAGLVCGILSVGIPWLVAPTATLAALAFASWAARAQRRGVFSRAGLDPGSVLALGLLGGVGVVYLEPPGPLLSWRGLLLAAGLLPLIATDRRRLRDRLVRHTAA